MKNSIILIISIVILLFCKSEAQNCIVSAAFTTPTEVMVTSGENCAEFYFGPMIEKTDIVLAITETSIDCSKNKIIVYDEVRNEIFDYCKAKEATRIKSKNATMTLKYFGSNIVVSLVSTTGDYLSCYLHFNKFDLIEDDETEEELTTTTETTTTIITTTTPTTTTSTTTTTTTTSTTTSTTTPMTTTTRAATTTTTIMITTTTTSTTITSTRFTTETTTKFGLFPNGGTSQINCGVPFFKPFGNELRIVGGIVSAANSWPWQVMITNDLYMCGASLINNQWILTAAHCVFNGYIKAYLGAHSKGFARTQKYYRISKIYKHERYDKNLIKNDIALMKLDTPVVFNEKIRPICLPTVFTATPTKHAIVTGWGLTQANMNGPTSDLLRQVTVPIRPSNRCQGFVLDRTQICAGDPDLLNPKDSCQGDSGGPLFIKEGNKYVLAGITSFGGPVCNGFGVYTNVYEFKDWIIQTMAKH